MTGKQDTTDLNPSSEERFSLVTEINEQWDWSTGRWYSLDLWYFSRLDWTTDQLMFVVDLPSNNKIGLETSQGPFQPVLSMILRM